MVRPLRPYELLLAVFFSAASKSARPHAVSKRIGEAFSARRTSFQHWHDQLFESPVRMASSGDCTPWQRSIYRNCGISS